VRLGVGACASGAREAQDGDGAVLQCDRFNGPWGAPAEQAIRHGCERLDRLGEHSYLSTYACELAEALYALGRYEESEQWALRRLELGSKDDLATQLLGLSVRSRLLARKGSARRGPRLGRTGRRARRLADNGRFSSTTLRSRW
jgi:hypothetical protein